MEAIDLVPIMSASDKYLAIIALAACIWVAQACSGSRPRGQQIHDAGILVGCTLVPLSDRDLAIEGAKWEGGAVLLKGHKFQPGKGALIVIREVNPSAELDASTFSFLTIQLPDETLGAIANYSAERLTLFYSDGTVTWGIGRFGDSGTGSVTIGPSTDGAGFTVDLNVKVTVKRSHRRSAAPEVVQISRRIEAKPIQFAELTPWLKAEVPHPRAKKSYYE